MLSPRVSILCITYNQQDLVEQTLLSALEQQYDNLQVVVSDDASLDSTAKVIRALAKKYRGRLVPVLNESRGGITVNTNRGLAHCDGEYLAFLGGDDIFLPGKVAKQVAFMQVRPEIALSYHDVDVFDSSMGNTLYFWSQRYGKMTGGAENVVRYGTYMCATSVMVRREYVPQAGFDNRIRSASDWLFWVQVLAQSGGGVGYMDRLLARYRRHAGNVTADWGWKFEDQYLTLALIESQYPGYVEAIRKRRSELYFMNSIWAWRQGNKSTAWKLGWNSFRLAPIFPPWLRLLLRESLFYARRRGKQDDLIRSLFLRKPRR